MTSRLPGKDGASSAVRAPVPPVAEASVAGRTAAILAGIGFGSLGIFSRLFYDEGGEAFTLLLVRFHGAALILIAIMLVRGRPLPSWRDTGVTALLGGATLAASACLFAGYRVASPGLVTLLFYIYPLVVTVAAYRLFAEMLTRSRVLLLGVGLVGIALTIGPPGSANAAGILWGLGAGFSLAVYILGSRYVMSRGVDSVQFVTLSFCSGAIILVPIAAIVGIDPPPTAAIGHTLSVVLLGTVAPILLFYFAVGRIGAGSSSRLATVEPVTAVVLSYLVLGDALASGQIVGGVLVVFAVVLLATQPGAIRGLLRRRL